MKKIAIVVAQPLLKNNIFTTLPPLDFDNYLYHQRLLKEKLLENGYDLATYDINQIEDSEIVFYYDSIEPLPKKTSQQRNFLFLWESSVISPKTYDLDKHKYFDKIFTWNDELVDGDRYIKICFSHEIISKINLDLSSKDKLCTLVAGNKDVVHPFELYTKRIEAIRWFEAHHPEDFDLYGRGWDDYLPRSWFAKKIYYRAPFGKKIMSFLFKKPYLSYKGELDAKIPVIAKYKFAICYENARDIPGYITEKIFHCFFAGCVPIYWGPDDITDYIPANCFIDKRKFTTYGELYDYISTMADEDYLTYLRNIELFLNSPEVKQFSARNFTEVVINEVVNEK
jgi:hypothetical protein